MNQETKTSITAQELPVDQRISFRLQRIGTLLTTQAVTLLKQAGGLTLNQWRLLSFLKERDGGSVHELARMGYIDKATMSRAAAGLEERGLIASETSTADRRTTVLKLTHAGHQTFADIAPMMIKRQAELMSALTDAERIDLFRALDKLEATITSSPLGRS